MSGQHHEGQSEGSHACRLGPRVTKVTSPNTFTNATINVSCWTPTVARHFEKHEADIVFVSEHRLSPYRGAQKYGLMTAQCRWADYAPFPAPAFDTVVGGLSAGVMILFSRQNAVFVEPLDLEDFDLRLCPALLSRIVACKAKLGGLIFLFVAIDGYHCEGLSEHNVAHTARSHAVKPRSRFAYGIRR